MGHSRNVVVVASAEAAIAIDGSVGTLSEIGIARKLGKPVIALGSWEFKGKWEDEAGVIRASTPLEAVQLAIGELKSELS